MTKEEYYMSKDIIEIIKYYNKNKDEKIEISKKKEDFYKKYVNYYNNSRVVSKVKFYKNSINKNLKVVKIKKEAINLNRLNKIISIYYSNISIYEKIEKISKVFENYNQLWSSYFDLIIPLLGTKFINDLNKIYAFMRKNKDLVEFISYYSKVYKKELSYEYSKIIIEKYMEKDVSCSLEGFLDEVGADIKLFNYCIDVIQDFDMDLYNKFIEIKEKNDVIETEYKKSCLIDLVNAIKTGKYIDGTEFSVSEFFKRIPYKYSKSFYIDIINFTKNNLPDDLELISNFLLENGFYRKDINKELQYDDIMTSSFVMNGKNIKNIDKLKVISYIQKNKLPLFYCVFFDIYSKYKTDKIQFDEINEYKKKKILIP